MGDLSVEPSMEEILSSIKRIIAEEGEMPGRGRRAPARGLASSSAAAAAVDEVLELSNPMPATPAAAELTRRAQAIEAQATGRALPVPAEPTVADRDDPVTPTTSGWAAEPLRSPEEPPMRARAAATPTPPAAEPAPAAPPADEPIVSSHTADASRGALDSLSKLVVKSDGGDGTLEGLVREMLRPMLRDWLDRNLPQMVETLVAREIARITQARD